METLQGFEREIGNPLLQETTLSRVIFDGRFGLFGNVCYKF